MCTKCVSNISASWAFRQTLFRQNPEGEDSPNFNDVKLSRYTVVLFFCAFSRYLRCSFIKAIPIHDIGVSYTEVIMWKLNSCSWNLPNELWNMNLLDMSNYCALKGSYTDRQTDTHTHTYTYNCIKVAPAYLGVAVPAKTIIHVATYIHTHTYTHTYILTCIHTYIHISYIQITYMSCMLGLRQLCQYNFGHNR